MSQGLSYRFTSIKRVIAPTSNAGETNLTVADRNTGTTMISGAADTKGNYVTVLTPSVNVYALWIKILSEGASATARGALMDIAIGGTPDIIVPDLNCGNASTSSNQYSYFIPGLSIPAGTAIKVRHQNKTTTISATVIIWTDPNFRMNLPNTTYITYGADTSNSIGTSVTPANGSFGSWTQIATTTRDHYYWLVGFDLLNNTGVASVDYLIEVGVGPTSGTVVSMGFVSCGQFNTELTYDHRPKSFSYATISGDKIWVRVASGGTVAFGVTLTAN